MVETSASAAKAGTVLEVYLLGPVDFDELLRVQRRLVYEVAGERHRGVLVLCEHPPGISVGREGSREHILCSQAELAGRGWPVRWVNRGGGCLLHLPGQLVAYPIVALDRLGLGLKAYLDHLHGVLVDVLADCELSGVTRPDHAGVWSNGRPIAQVGVAVCDWVAYFGAALNVHPDVELFRRVHCGGPDRGPMTSMERERRSPVRDATVRQRFIEQFCRQFEFERTSLFHHLPGLTRPARTHAVTPRSA